MSEQIQPVRVAIVGLGMGWHHISQFRKHPNALVAAVCDLDHEKCEHAKREFGIEHAFSSIDDLLRWGEFDLASLALPNDLHEPVTLRFLEAHKHVLAEKPLAMNAEQGQRIVDAARSSGKKIAIHYNQRMSPEHQLIRRAFEAGDFGRIHYLRAGWMRKKGIPVGAAGWFTKKERSGGGPLIDIGVHMLDSALYVAGFPKVVSVSGQTHQFFADRDLPEKGMDVEDFAVAFIRCEGGLTITLEVSWAGYHEHSQEAYLHLYGTESGAHRRTYFDEKWNADTTLTFSRRLHGATTTEHVDVMPQDLKSVQEDLVQAIIDDREPICTVEQGLVVMRILDAIYESSKTGREVVLAG